LIRNLLLFLKRRKELAMSQLLFVTQITRVLGSISAHHWRVKAEAIVASAMVVSRRLATMSGLDNEDAEAVWAPRLADSHCPTSSREDPTGAMIVLTLYKPVRGSGTSRPKLSIFLYSGWAEVEVVDPLGRGYGSRERMEYEELPPMLGEFLHREARAYISECKWLDADAKLEQIMNPNSPPAFAKTDE
jgi:hypothetical protein